MKKFVSAILTAAMISATVTLPVNAADTDKATETISYSYSYGDAKTYSREMEKLNRGLVAIRTTDGVYLSWRLFDSEDARFGSAEKNVSFNIYRNGSKIDNVADTTNYTDTTAGTSYSVAPVINGVEGEKCDAVQATANNYFDIPLTKPADETIYDTSGNVSATYSFFPADCSTGDLDGDGEYEIIVKWTSSERDVGSPGDAPVYSGTVHLAAYKLDGTKMWQNDIELGKNVFSSAHTVQFTVYDFDGDGKAEMMCQTSLGSKDAAGNYVSKAADPDTDIYAITDEENATTDYRNGWVINTGREFLTVFNGETGAAIDTIDLPTSRGTALGVDYGDDSGNRSNRFLSDVAYLDGEKPYAVYMRGYYFGKNGRQRTSIAGISFDGERLSPDYRFDTKSGQPGYYEGAYQYVGQGNHNCTVADVDNDGKDEFITGALCMEVNDENQFRPKWCTYLQHGDALHIGDYDPTHKGLEFFTVHEDSGTNSLSGTDITMDFGMSVIDAATGEIMFHESNDNDTGRGMMANVGAGGYYQISSHAQSSNAPAGATKFDAGPYKAMGNGVFTFDNSVNLSQNFRIFWDGDLYDELLDGTSITSWNGRKLSEIFNAGSYDCVQINGTKANPSLQADLFGDWREELVYPTTDGNALRVFTTTTPTEYKIKTLMHDPVYRSGVAAEQTAYNQPPHVGFYMGQEMFNPDVERIEITSQPAKTIYTFGEPLDTTGLTVRAYYMDDSANDITSFAISGYDPNKAGTQTVTITYMGKTTEFTVTVKEVTRIEITSPPSNTSLSLGQTLNTSGLVVTAYYNDGSSQEITNYTLSGYDPQALGNQTITVEFIGKTAAFTVTVNPASISSINGTYETNSTTSVMSEIPISSYDGTFILEHTVKINSMPANGSQDKNSTDGFLIKFMPRKEGTKNGVGAGWYMTASGTNKANILWKADGRTATSVTSTPITIGQEYTFKYTFADVGTGNGARVSLEIFDSSGNSMGSASGLSLRNMTSSANHVELPMTYISLYNQAKSNSTASVTINNANIYGNSEIVDVTDKNVVVNLSTLSNTSLYAAKYDEHGVLTNAEILTLPQQTGERTVQASFAPDKVFLWTDNMYPMDMWSNTSN